MNESQYQPLDHEAAVDRLASGEIDPAARRELFAWLDDEPRRWRRCALALLEARELEQALGDWNAEVPLAAPSRRVGIVHQSNAGHQLNASRRRLSRHGARALALAASLLIAFGLGVGARGFWPESTHTPSAANHKAQDTMAKAERVAQTESPRAVHTQLSAMPAATDSRGADALISPYVRSQLERRGYEVESRHAVVPVKLPDGRRVMLPVDQYQLRYVGHRAS